FAPAVPWSIGEALAGVIDAAVLADDHRSIIRVTELAAERPGRGQSFQKAVAAELQSPLRLAWLIERVRSGTADIAGLDAWLGRAYATQPAMLLEAIEALEPGPL